ncbi:helix-turn-helix transcriptional regulator [Streptomyces sp. P38-E01]|uniref:Helix-turn-helix transcriptional regulator n=1 Tax=Streptomyces tardus TaxID=2780544 RepID=A0A949N8X4_9ACTN|nr:helix-turn-helix transcriptional regulator [Streptomyces tardus]MBU7598353.1 helix-turn-helix transcriptional regulator [Streptomyces tardus]
MPKAEREPYSEELRARREEAGLTQKELAELLAVHSSLVAHWEAGRRLCGPRDASRLDQTLKTGGTFVRFLRKDDYARRFERVATAEAHATRIEEYAPVLVPGILQTRPYALEVHRSAQFSWRPEELDTLIVNRMNRTKILEQQHPQLWYILSEAVLRTVVGGPALMAEQLAHIAALTRVGRIGLQVMPFSEGAHAAMDSLVTLMRFDNAPELAYVEGVHTNMVVDADESYRVQKCRDAYDLTRSSALSPRTSLHFLESVTEEYRSHERPRSDQPARLAQIQLQQR